MNCPFCDIDPERNRILEERSLVFVILSNPRLMPGHTLVIPKRHVEKPSELTDAEREELFNTVLEYQDKITAVFSKGCDIRQNYRPFAPQSQLKVNHVHMHLIPREMEDELYQHSMKFEKDIFVPLSDDEREKFTKLLGRS